MFKKKFDWKIFQNYYARIYKTLNEPLLIGYISLKL